MKYEVTPNVVTVITGRKTSLVILDCSAMPEVDITGVQVYILYIVIFYM